MTTSTPQFLRAALAALACVLGLLVTNAGFAAEAKKSFDIPAGTALPALKQFVAQSGEQLLYSAEAVEGVTTNAVKGTFTAREALDQMVGGTRLTVVADRKNGALSLVRVPGPNAARAALEKNSDRPTSRSKIEDGRLVLDKVEVTGSRIRSLVGAADINPVITFGRADIERSGVTSIGELSRLTPQAYSQASYDGIGFGGQNTGMNITLDGSSAGAATTSRSTFNLRGLGGQNTLVLVNGRRVARTGVASGSDASDLAGISVSSIERVEILLGGASAIYGSDAVGGVINIILRRNYSGGEAALSYENTFASDTAVRTATVTYGLTTDRLELQLSATAQDRNAFAAVDRRFSATDAWITLGGTSNLASIGSGGIITGAGLVQATSGNLPGTTSRYAAIPDNAGTASLPASAYISVPATGLAPYTGDRAKYVNLISPQQNYGASLRANYRLTDNHDIYLEARYSATETDIEGLPVNYRNFVSVPADYPGNPFGVPVWLHKTFWELGPIQGQKTALTSNTALAAGFRGKLPFSDWRYDAGFDLNRGYLENKNALDSGLNLAIFNPLIAARSLVLFYDSRTQQPNDLKVLRSMLVDGGNSERDTNETFTASADGSIWELPAGPIRLAIGGEWRAERARTAQAQPENPLINLNLVGDFKRTAEAVFAETRVPLFSEKQHLPLLHSLEISVAARYDSYSDVGGDVSPGYGIIWHPVKWALLRASRNHAFRAPGLQALYRPITSSTLFVSSFFGSTIDPGRGSTLVPDGFYNATIGGNLGLKPEKSISDNVGIVLESPVDLFKGFSFSVDYQVIDYSDRIIEPGAQALFDFFPDRVMRGPKLATDPANYLGPVIGFDTRAVNISQLEIQAVDYQLGYRRSTSWGTFDARVAMTDYIKYLATSVPAAVPTSTLNRFPTRLSWQTYWTKGPYGFGVSGFYQEKQYLDLTYTTPRFRSAVEWNTQLAYDFDRRMGGTGLNDTRAKRWLFTGTKLSLNVNNVFDREPPHIQGQAGFAVTDPRMARYVLTLRKIF